MAKLNFAFSSMFIPNDNIFFCRVLACMNNIIFLVSFFVFPLIAIEQVGVISSTGDSPYLVGKLFKSLELIIMQQEELVLLQKQLYQGPVHSYMWRSWVVAKLRMYSHILISAFSKLVFEKQ